MKFLSLNGPQDFLGVIVRRKRWIVFPFLALSGALLLVTYMLPRMYVSESLILIRPRDVPEEFVKELIAGTTEQRLRAIEQTVLSRTILVQILTEFGERLPEYKRFNMDEKVLKLRDQIKVSFQGDKPTNQRDLPLTYFRISYRNTNPDLAQKIAAKLTSLFIDQDSKARESQVFGTTEFLEGELAKISDQLKQSETTLKELRSRHRYELPDQLDANLRTLDRLGLQKQANAEALDRFETIRLNIESQITQTPPTLPSQPPSTPAPRKGKSALVEEYQKKQIQLDDLTTKYTPQHPDVEAAKAQLQRLKDKIPAEELEALDKEPKEESQPTGTPQPNPVYQNLVAQLEQVKTELELRQKERKLVQDSIATFTERVQNAPASQQEMVEILRQNTDLTKQYDKLKNDLGQAKLAESLESKQKGAQFVIVDPANYPLTPTKPAKTNIAAGSVLASLAAGILIAFLADIFSQKMWTHTEVEALLGVTVLAEIPEILTPSDVSVARRKKYVFIASSVGLAAVYSVCLYVLYTKQTLVLRSLDSVLQKLY